VSWSYSGFNRLCDATCAIWRWKQVEECLAEEAGIVDEFTAGGDVADDDEDDEEDDEEDADEDDDEDDGDDDDVT
jgi:hypothetical protein